MTCPIGRPSPISCLAASTVATTRPAAATATMPFAIVIAHLAQPGTDTPLAVWPFNHWDWPVSAGPELYPYSMRTMVFMLIFLLMSGNLGRAFFPMLFYFLLEPKLMCSCKSKSMSAAMPNFSRRHAIGTTLRVSPTQERPRLQKIRRRQQCGYRHAKRGWRPVQGRLSQL